MEETSGEPTLLVIEDNPVITTLVQKVFQRQGRVFRMLTAIDGKDGLEVARREGPDLILLDWMLPEYDGKYFLENQKEDAEISEIPVFVHTALKRSHLRDLLKSFPSVKNFIQKPMIPSKLYKVIVEYLTNPQASEDSEDDSESEED